MALVLRRLGRQLGPKNSRTLGHPRSLVPESAEAMLVINIPRTMLHYIDAKLSAE